MKKAVMAMISFVVLFSVAMGYTLTIHEESRVVTEEVSEGETVTIGLPDRSRAKYTVNQGNPLLRDFGNRCKFIMPAENVEITIEKVYVITFNSNGGNRVVTKKMVAGEPYGTLPIPSKSGSTFAGWYSDSGLTTEVTSTDTVPASDHTLYAKWNQTEVFTFGTNGNTTWAKSQGTTVSISGIAVKSGTAKYLWKQGTATADEISSSGTSFTSGDTVTKSDGTGNNWRLNVYCEDTNENQYIAASDVFYLDNTAPTVTLASKQFKMFPDLPYRLSNITEETVDGVKTYTTTSTIPIIYLETGLKKGISGVTFSISPAPSEDLPIRIYTNEHTTLETSILGSVPAGKSRATIEIPEGDYTQIGVRVGSEAGLTFTMNPLDVFATDNDLSHPTYIRFNLSGTDAHSGNITYQVSSDNKATWSDVSGTQYTAKEPGTYYFRAKDKLGNISEAIGGYTHTRSYKLYFNSNGGSTVATQIVKNGDTYGTLPTPTKTNYTFAGWYKESSLTNQVTSSTTVTATGNHTLYAKWTGVKSNVTLNNQSATTAGTTSVTATYGSAMPSITKPSKTGYTFGGYYTETNGGGTQYYKADGSSAKNWDKTAATTLYAKWTVNTYTVTLNNQSATTAGTTSVTATYGSAMPSITKPAKTGYTFGGYYTETNGGGTQYYKADGSSAKNWDKTAATTLYAKWTANTYTVTLNNQSATTAGTTSVTATYGSAMPSITVPTKTDYRFLGYYTGTNGTGTQYYTSTGTSIKNWDKTTATTLYAAWKSVIPTYTYTGTSSTSKDDTYWYIYLKSSGNLTFSEAQSIDIFLVGGGGGGYNQSSGTGRRGGGGGGGYTATHKGIYAANGTTYSIVVGAGGAVNCKGGTTSAFGKSVSGGYPGTHCDNIKDGGDGGSGGGAGADFRTSSSYSGTAGASNGNSATSVSYGSPWNDYNYGGTGQGSTTRAFGTGALYAGGGGGGGQNPSSGGAGGGGAGAGNVDGISAVAGTANTGGGGGGGSGDSTWARGAAGGSGVVIIRGLH
ncbi:MAG: InlB B-repeat-containing protein [Clostridia bacterium]|nr:InlB B-repeat-containing protein [Clostridia bacterium]